MVIPGLKGMSLGRFAKAVGKTFVRDDVVDLAAMLAFYGILAVFPFMLFLLTIIGFMHLGPSTTDQVYDYAAKFMPTEAAQVFTSTVKTLANSRKGWLLIVSILVSLYSAASGVTGLMTALNRTYDASETRSWVRRELVAMGLTILGAVVMIVATTGLVIGPAVAHHIAVDLGVGHAFDVAWTWLRWPVIVVLVSLMFAFFYWACPNVDQKFKYLTPGSVTGVILWVGVSYLFNLYVANFGSYDKTYGTLGGVVVLLTWIWISSMILLLGGVMNAVIWCASHPEAKNAQGLPACDVQEERRSSDDREPVGPGGGGVTPQPA